MPEPNKEISPDRKTLYYVGMVLMGIGFLLFLSTFVTFLANFGNFDNFEGRARSQGFRAFGGMILVIIGGVLRGIGSQGWSGSGIVLDPKKAREDVERWSRMHGGMIQDALSEIDVVKKFESRLDPAEPQIKVRCRKCRALNDESAKFCDQCGSPI